MSEKVPVTSFNTKWALAVKSGGLSDEYLNPPSLILTESIAPISSVTASKAALVPVVVDIVIVGKLVYPPPPSEMWIFCIAPASDAEKVADSKTIWSVVVVCVSSCSKSIPSSVIIWCPASVEEESVPSKSIWSVSEPCK